MSKAPSMPMYWDAYIADTTHLSCEEHGAYLMLLGAMWRRNGWVPDDDKDNARILGLTPAKWRRIKVRLSDFLVFDGGNISQEKLLKTWQNTQEKIAKNKVNGAKGGRAAASNNNNLGKANAAETLKPKPTIPEPEPEPIQKEPIGSQKTDLFAVDDPPPKRKQKRAVQMPEGWVPNERNIQDAEERNFSKQEINDEADRFRNYCHANGKAYKDWDAAWRNWLGNARKFGRGGGMAGQAVNGGGQRGDSLAAIVARRRMQGEV